MALQNLPKENVSPRVTSKDLIDYAVYSDGDLSSIEENIKDFAEKHDGANLLNEQDELGRTVAHYVALRGRTRHWNYDTQQIVGFIFANKADFSIQDNEGNTPMHLMAMGSDHRAGIEMFEHFISYAASTGFDFALLNKRGLSVLHLAAIFQYKDRLNGKDSDSVRSILAESIQNNLLINLDILSSSGSTTLYYLINHGRDDEALLILKAGASPTKHGDNAERKPLNEVRRHIEKYKKEYNFIPEKLQLLESRLMIAEPASNYQPNFFQMEKVSEISGPMTLTPDENEQWNAAIQGKKVIRIK